MPKLGCRVWLLRNWFGILLLLFAVLGLVIALLLYIQPCKKKTVQTVTEVVTETVEEVQKPADIMLLLDGSSSILPSQFEQLLGAAATLVRQLALNVTDMQVGVIQWSDSYTRNGITSNPDKMRLEAPLTNATAGVLSLLGPGLKNRQLHGGTAFAPPLRACREQLLGARGRPDAYKLCVLATDGGNSDRVAAVNVSTDMFRDGIHITGIFVGDDRNANLEPAMMKLYAATDCAQIGRKQDPANCGFDDGQASSFGDEGLFGDRVQFGFSGKFALCRANCSYYTAAADFGALQAKAARIADEITVTVGRQRVVRRAVDEVVETNEVCTTDEGYFTFLLFVIPFLAHVFWKPLEFALRQYCRRRGRCKSKKKRKKVRVRRQVMQPQPQPPSEAQAEDGGGGGGGGGGGDGGGGGQKRFKHQLKSSDRYLWSSAGGTAPMKVDFGAKAPPSAPKVSAEAYEWVEVEEWEDAEGTEAWSNTFEAVFNGGDWQEWVSRRVCSCCWAKVDRARTVAGWLGTNSSRDLSTDLSAAGTQAGAQQHATSRNSSSSSSPLSSRAQVELAVVGSARQTEAHLDGDMAAGGEEAAAGGEAFAEPFQENPFGPKDPQGALQQRWQQDDRNNDGAQGALYKANPFTSPTGNNGAPTPPGELMTNYYS